MTATKMRSSVLMSLASITLIGCSKSDLCEDHLKYVNARTSSQKDAAWSSIRRRVSRAVTPPSSLPGLRLPLDSEYRTVIPHLDCPEYPHSVPRKASVYIRPHEMEISHTPNGSSSLEAKVVHVRPAGSVARVQLRTVDSTEPVHVEISPAKYVELGLEPGETVYLFPRKVRVFVPAI